MRIRKAKLSDSELLFNWRNDSLTREMSRNNEKIKFIDHEKWLKKALLEMEKDKIIYIVQIDDLPIGVVRFDRLEEYKYEVNIDINPQSRGKNYGIKVTALGILELEKDRNAKVIFSTVKKVNVPSLKLFERLGFRETESDKIYNYYLLNIKEDLNREYI